MTRYRLLESESAIADANGRAEVAIGPSRSFERWFVRSVTVQSTSSTLVPTMREYRGFVAEGNLTGTSRSGDLDTGTANFTLEPQEQLFYVWEGCDVGARCTVVIQGESEKP